MIVLEQNEVVLEDGVIGILEPEADPTYFLTVDRIEYTNIVGSYRENTQRITLDN